MRRCKFRPKHSSVVYKGMVQDVPMCVHAALLEKHAVHKIQFGRPLVRVFLYILGEGACV